MVTMFGLLASTGVSFTFQDGPPTTGVGVLCAEARLALPLQAPMRTTEVTPVATPEDPSIPQKVLLPLD